MTPWQQSVQEAGGCFYHVTRWVRRTAPTVTVLDPEAAKTEALTNLHYYCKPLLIVKKQIQTAWLRWLPSINFTNCIRREPSYDNDICKVNQLNVEWLGESLFELIVS